MKNNLPPEQELEKHDETQAETSGDQIRRCWRRSKEFNRRTN